MADLASGRGPLFTDPDPEVARAFFRGKKAAFQDKVMTVKEAVATFVQDGDYVASGGFGANRISTSCMHEMVRQRKQDLGFAGHTTTHDFQILAAGNRYGGKLLGRVDAAYIVGLEARGVSFQARKIMQSGEVEVCEWSNFALACRFRAAAAGIPYVPMRSLLGTDTFERSAAKEVTCPFTSRRLLAIPALYPDVSFIHVHESDRLGNARIKGIGVADFDLARASKRLVLTTERLVSTNEIRSDSNATTIPSYCVDAVCVVPYGSYPGNMPGEYFSDEAHLKMWLEVEKDEKEYETFLERYILGVDDHATYLEQCGGESRIAELRASELMAEDGN
ncbi:MAG TPA: CoA transferase subunit A [Candidatus Latescibacteria bacterium]|nr:CoA transferase subunit A [Candidatus Latescibacterota bacterium]